MRGTILDFYQVPGFGYLKDEEKDEYCFYTNDILMTGVRPKKGDQVNFDLYKGQGIRAINVRRSI